MLTCTCKISACTGKKKLFWEFSLFASKSSSFRYSPSQLSVNVKEGKEIKQAFSIERNIWNGSCEIAYVKKNLTHSSLFLLCYNLFLLISLSWAFILMLAIRENECSSACFEKLKEGRICCIMYSLYLSSWLFNNTRFILKQAFVDSKDLQFRFDLDQTFFTRSSIFCISSSPNWMTRNWRYPEHTQVQTVSKVHHWHAYGIEIIDKPRGRTRVSDGHSFT